MKFSEINYISVELVRYLKIGSGTVELKEDRKLK
jgi:hypothetical protein